MAAEAAKPKKWRNPYRKLPAIRWGVQGLYLAFLVLVGIQFAVFYRQVVSGGALTASRPSAVEGFLPISALIGLKRFLLTGAWDDVHPAGLTILIAVIGGALLARKAFCSWICPVGTISRALEWVGAKTIWRRRRKEVLVPRWLDVPLSGLKYLLLGFFALSVARMDLESLDGFMHSTFNYVTDARMFLFFADLSSTAAIVLGVLVVLSIVVKNFWCRYLCPYGGLLGLFSWMSPQRPVRDASTCIDCKLCTKACPVEIRVHQKAAVLSPECTGCMACVAVCPIKDCMTVGRKAEKGWSPWFVPAIGIGLLLILWAGARLTGHWNTQVPLETLGHLYRFAGQLSHPGL